MESNWDIEFTVPGNPVALKRHRSFQKGEFRGTYDPSKNDKADFLSLAMQHKPDVPFDEPLKVCMYFFFKRPKAHFRSGKNSMFLKDSAPLWHTGTPDIDNLIKFIGDSLNGVFWMDDKYVCEISAFKLYAANPRILIQIVKHK